MGADKNMYREIIMDIRILETLAILKNQMEAPKKIIRFVVTVFE